ncbi:hypothetical protein LCGC14_1822870 [marine sediment metagenome]|uniref:Uncharacterized protein n=1 Tax=marine sediment metagenome TaxID=412755 RepID=A0A0F9H6J2_9ZZZZ
MYLRNKNQDLPCKRFLDVINNLEQFANRLEVIDEINSIDETINFYIFMFLNISKN